MRSTPPSRSATATVVRSSVCLRANASRSWVSPAARSVASLTSRIASRVSSGDAAGSDAPEQHVAEHDERQQRRRGVDPAGRQLDPAARRVQRERERRRGEVADHHHQPRGRWDVAPVEREEANEGQRDHQRRRAQIIGRDVPDIAQQGALCPAGIHIDWHWHWHWHWHWQWRWKGDTDRFARAVRPVR
jgi:hypothetical protein